MPANDAASPDTATARADAAPSMGLLQCLGKSVFAAALCALFEAILTTATAPVLVSDLAGLGVFWLGSVAYLSPLCLLAALLAYQTRRNDALVRFMGSAEIGLACAAAVTLALAIFGLRAVLVSFDVQFPAQVAHAEFVADAGLAFLVILAFVGLRRTRLGRWQPDRPTARRILAVTCLVAGAGGVVFAWSQVAPVHMPRMALGLGSAGMVLIAYGFCIALPRFEGRSGGLVGGLLIIAWAALWPDGGAQRHATFIRFAHAPFSGGIGRMLRRAVDLDGDGGGPRWLGGTDCAEGDSRVGPSAREIPGDGIDQDCRGGDASPTRQRSALAPVWSGCHVSTEPLSALLITVDDMRAEALDPRLTPRLVELARHAFRFSRAYAPSTMTNISMAAVFSGRPYSDVVGPNATPIPRLLGHIPSIVSAINQAGIETVAFNRFQLDPALVAGFSQLNPQDVDIVSTTNKRPLHSAAQTNAVLDWLERPDQQRFIWVHYGDMHAPYSVPNILDDDVAGYWAALRYIDMHIGRLLTGLEARGQLGRFAIAVTSDHGEDLGGHNSEGHGPLVYDDSTRVPLLLWIPGCPPRIIDHPVSVAAVVPTLAALMGVTVPQRQLDLAPPPGSLPVVAEAGDGDGLTFQRAIIEDDLKLIIDVHSGGRLLFDLGRDPLERINIYGSNSEAASKAEAAYQRWLDAPGER